METKVLNVEERAEAGTSAVRRLRKSGFVPAVVYGEGFDTKTVSLPVVDYRRVVRGAGPTQIFKFHSSNSGLNGAMALIKDVQLEPIKDQILHVDFLRISENHRITLSVPLELVGDAPAVKINDCILNQSAYEIEIECLPLEIPSAIKVDISALVVAGDSIHAEDVKLPNNVRLRSEGMTPIVSAIHKKEEAAATPAAAAAAPAAPAKGAAAAKK